MLIYCVEDDESIRELILYALKSGGYRAEGFESGVEFFNALKNNLPDMILLDVMLPSENGFAILKRLKDNISTKSIPVIMVTAKNNEFDKVKGLDLGADDYMTKPFGIMELLSRIRAVIRRTQKESSSSVLIAGCVRIDNDKRTVSVNDVPCNLTFKEYELLHYLVKNNGIVLSRDKILQKVWGFDFEGESRTVDMHIKTLRQKLAEAGADDVIVTIRSVGYKFEV